MKVIGEETVKDALESAGLPQVGVKGIVGHKFHLTCYVSSNTFPLGFGYLLAGIITGISVAPGNTVRLYISVPEIHRYKINFLEFESLLKSWRLEVETGKEAKTVLLPVELEFY